MIEVTVHWVVPGLIFLADWSVRWGVVLLLLALGFGLKPPRRAVTRHLLASVALVVGVLLPLVPRWGGVVVPWPTRQAGGVVEPSLARREVVAEDHEPLRLAQPPDPGRAAAPKQTVPVSAARGPGSLVPAWRVHQSEPLGLARIAGLGIGALWLFTVTVLLARLGGGWLLLGRLRAGAEAVDERSALLFEECRRSVRLTRPIALAVHPGVGSPVVMGGWRPLILVPPDWQNWPEPHRRACLLHELAHLLRFDDWARMVEELILVPFFFHPLVRWLVHRLDRERELLCDELVVTHGAEPVGYAGLLLDLARRPGRLLPEVLRLGAGSLPFFERGTVAARIERLLEDDMRRPMAPVSPRRLLAVGSLALAAALGLGTLTLRVRAVEPPRSSDERPAPRPVDREASLPGPRVAPGLVQDAEGHPVPGALVVTGLEKPERPPVVLLTGVDGRFQLELPEGEVTFEMATHKDGYTWAASQSFAPAGQAPHELKLTLSRPEPFTAVLVDEQGRPVAGATVLLQSAAHRRKRADLMNDQEAWVIETSYTRVPWKVVTGTALEPVFAATSDDQGQFTLGVLPRDCWVRLWVKVPRRPGVMLVKPGTGPSAPAPLFEEGYVTSGGGPHTTLTLRPAARVRGRVVTRLPGVSVAGRRIGLQGAHAPDSAIRTNNWVDARTDAEGRFEIDGLNAGIANILVTDAKPDGPWTYRAVKDARLAFGETTEVEIELIKGVEVEGRVVASQTQKPIAGVGVAQYGPTHPRSGAAINPVKSDANGTFRFRLPSGETYFYIYSQVAGYTTLPENRSSRTVVIPQDTDRFTVPPIAMQPAVRILGQVVDGRGRPILGARIVGVCDQNRCMPLDQPAAVSDALGHFRLVDEAGGQFPVKQASTFQVRLHDGRQFDVPAVPDDRGVVVLKIQALSGNEVQGPATVAPSEIAGVVVDAEGKPIEGVEVAAYYWIPRPPKTTTDRNGLFRIANLPEDGEINIRLRKEDYETQYHNRPTGQPGWAVVLGNGTYFEGRVRAPDGTPVAGAVISADAGPKRYQGYGLSETLSETRSGPDGRYCLHVVPGQYDIAVRVPGVGVARRTGELIGPDAHRTLDIPLEPGATFVARVVDCETHQPIDGVRLWHWQRPGIEGTSDAHGRIEIRDVPAGNYPRFEVKAKGYTRWWSDACLSEWARYQKSARHGFQRNFDDLDFDIQPGMGPVTIEFERGVTLKGRVLDPDGKPVAGATVAPALTGSGNSLTGDTRFSVSTDADGQFTMLLPASGDREYNLVAHDGRLFQWRTWANGVLPTFRTRPGQETGGLTLRLTRPATVRGRVLDPRGRPVAGREVRSSAGDRMENRYYDPTIKTGEDGRYELKFIRPGEQFIQVAPFWLDAKQAHPGTSQTLTLEPGETRDGVDFQVFAAAGN
jgi:protocatechuate 3,4-dioxygenase beta subunit